MGEKTAVKSKFLTYKGKPLVRCNDIIYYGDLNDAYVIRMQIKSTKKEKDIELSDKVTVQLVSTDFSLSPKNQIIKSSEKQGLYLAMDIADIWLCRALSS